MNVASGGKIGSALAAFESNIARNNEYGNASSKSFLTGIASSFRSCSKSPAGRARRHSCSSKGLLSRASTDADDDIDETEEVGYTVRWSPKKASLTVGSAPRSIVSAPLKLAALPFGNDNSESSQCLSESNHSCISETSNQSSTTEATVESKNSKKKKIKKVVVVRRLCSSELTDNSQLQPSSPNKTMVQKVRVRTTSPCIYTPQKKRVSSSGVVKTKGHNRGSSLTDYSVVKNNNSGSSSDLAYCSPTEDTENSSFESPEGRCSRSQSRSRCRSNSRSRKSPLDKIAATLTRENSGKALMVAAQAAARKIASHPPKKRLTSPLKTATDDVAVAADEPNIIKPNRKIL